MQLPEAKPAPQLSRPKSETLVDGWATTTELNWFDLAEEQLLSALIRADSIDVGSISRFGREFATELLTDRMGVRESCIGYSRYGYKYFTRIGYSDSSPFLEHIQQYVNLLDRLLDRKEAIYAECENLGEGERTPYTMERHGQQCRNVRFYRDGTFSVEVDDPERWRRQVTRDTEATLRAHDLGSGSEPDDADGLDASDRVSADDVRRSERRRGIIEVVGTSRYDGKQILRSLAKDQGELWNVGGYADHEIELTLVPEPDNSHDPHAVMVISEHATPPRARIPRSGKIGYLPRDVGITVDHPVKVTATVSEGYGNFWVKIDLNNMPSDPLTPPLAQPSDSGSSE